MACEGRSGNALLQNRQIKVTGNNQQTCDLAKARLCGLVIDTISTSRFDTLIDLLRSVFRQTGSKDLKPPFLISGSPTWARTRDPMINSHLLYQLSYRGSQRDAIVITTPVRVNKVF